MAGNDERIRFAGEVKVEKALLHKSQGGMFQNIMNQIAGIVIYEDIFSPFLSGHVMIKDTLDLVNLFPLTGQEFIELEISTPTLDDETKLKFTAVVYKMSEREILGDKAVFYKLHFTSLESLINVNKKVSRAYRGNIGEIVQDILTDRYDGLETEKGVFIEPTTKDHQYVSNFWSPLENINYLTRQATNKDGAKYVFFENRDGFYFITLESLYDQESYHEFTMDKYTRDSLGDGTKDVKNVGEDYKRILSLSIETGFDYIARLKSGMFASRQISYDLFTKKYTVKDFNMADDFPELKNLNPHIGISQTNIARNAAAQMTYIKTSKIFADFDKYEGDTSDYAQFQKHKALSAMANLNTLIITVPGRVDYTAGMKVKVTLPLMNPLNPEDTDYTDKRFSGYYIISAINHNIGKKQHECTMELISDSLQMSADGDDGAQGQ
jgi:hypothetical protein